MLPAALPSPTESVPRQNLVDKLSPAPLSSYPPWPAGTQQIIPSGSQHGLQDTVPIAKNPILHFTAQTWKDNSVGVSGSVGHTVRAYNHSPYANVSPNVQSGRSERQFAQEVAAQSPTPKQTTAVKYPPYIPPAAQSRTSFPRVPQTSASSNMNSTLQYPASAQPLKSPSIWNLNAQSNLAPKAMGSFAHSHISKPSPPPPSNTSPSMQTPTRFPLVPPGFLPLAMPHGPCGTQTPPLTPPEYPLPPASEPLVGHVHPQASSFKLQPTLPVKPDEKSAAAPETNSKLNYNLNYNLNFGGAPANFQRNIYDHHFGRGSPAPIPLPISERIPLAGWVLKRPGENQEISERGKEFLSISPSHALIQANATEPEEWWCHPANCENCWGLKPRRPSRPVQMSSKQ